jgi:hypothetical protein
MAEVDLFLEHSTTLIQLQGLYSIKLGRKTALNGAKMIWKGVIAHSKVLSDYSPGDIVENHKIAYSEQLVTY